MVSEIRTKAIWRDDSSTTEHVLHSPREQYKDDLYTEGV